MLALQTMAQRRNPLHEDLEKEVTPLRARIARQLRALGKRHDVAHIQDLSRRLKQAHEQGLIDKAPNVVTLHRINDQDVDADRITLRRIAEALGESVDNAFPEGDPASSHAIKGRVYLLRTEDGRPPDPQVTALLNLLSAGLDLSLIAKEAAEKRNRPTQKLPAGRKRS